jgi:hypothetical protein
MTISASRSQLAGILPVLAPIVLGPTLSVAPSVAVVVIEFRLETSCLDWLSSIDQIPPSSAVVRLTDLQSSSLSREDKNVHSLSYVSDNGQAAGLISA